MKTRILFSRENPLGGDKVYSIEKRNCFLIFFVFNIANANLECNLSPSISTGDMRSRLRFSTLICYTLLFFTPIAIRAAERNVSYSLQRVIDKLFTKKITSPS